MANQATSTIQNLIYQRESAISYIISEVKKLTSDKRWDRTYIAQQLKGLVDQFRNIHKQWDDKIKAATATATEKAWDQYYNEPMGSDAEEVYKLRQLTQQKILTHTLLKSSRASNNGLNDDDWRTQAQLWLDRKVEWRAAAYIDAIRSSGQPYETLEYQLEELRDATQPNRLAAKSKIDAIDTLTTEYKVEVLKEAQDIAALAGSGSFPFAIDELI